MCATRYESGAVRRRNVNKLVSAGLREEGTKEVYNGEVESDSSANTQTKNLESRRGEEWPQRTPRDLGNRLKGNRSRLVIVQQRGGWLGALVNWRRIYGLGRLSGYTARAESGQSAFRCRRVQRRHASLRRAAGRRSRD